MHQRVAAAYGDYEKGKQALEFGDKNLAFASWLEFLTKEAALLDGMVLVIHTWPNDAEDGPARH